MNADPDAIDYGIVTPEPSADSYIEQMYNRGIIDNKVFATALRDRYNANPSFIDIGFYDNAAMDNPNDLLWLDVVSWGQYGQFFWANYLTGIRFRDQVTGSRSYAETVSSAEEYATTTYDIIAIADTGTSCLTVPNELHDFMVETIILPKLSYYEWDNTYGWGYLYNCDEINLLPNIDLLYGGVWLEVLVDDYVVRFASGSCGFCFSKSYNTNLAILGDTFLRNWYMIHDMERMKMGFTPLTGVDIVKAAPAIGETPSCNFDSTCYLASLKNWWNNLSNLQRNLIIWSGILLFFVIIPGILIWYVCFYRKNKKKEEEENKFDPDDPEWNWIPTVDDTTQQDETTTVNETPAEETAEETPD